MTYPASIAQITNNPSPFPGACAAYFTAFLALAGVVAALVIWPEQADQPAQAHGGGKPANEIAEDVLDCAVGADFIARSVITSFQQPMV